MKIVSPEVMAGIDRKSISEFEIPGELLMENAGIKCWERVKDFITHNKLKGKSVSIVAGSGNNGGDALVIAREAWISDFRNIKVILLKEDGNELFSLNKNICRRYGIPVISYRDNTSGAVSALNESGIIIDGLTGTGLRGAIRGTSRELVDIINGSDATVFSIDLPSGLGDGFLSGYPAVKADITLTIGLPKIVLYNPVARIFSGEIVVVKISFPPDLLGNPSDSGELYVNSDLNLPEIERWAYKGTRGHAAVFAGAEGTSGAALLAAIAAGRSRSGLVTLFVDSNIYSTAASQLKSIMVRKLDYRGEELELRGITSLLAGPGWGQEGRIQLLEKLFETSIPGVLDAEGLYFLPEVKKRSNKPGFLGGKWVFTPHPGEFETISNVQKEEFLAAPLPYLRKIAAEYGAVIVLKSHVTFIVNPEGAYSIVDGMIPSLGTGGSGDILSGIITGLMAQGIDPYQAAVEGVLLHQNAGKLCYKEKGWYLAEDLLPYISKAAAGRKNNSG